MKSSVFYEAGFTIVELMVTLSVATILAGYGVVQLHELSRPAESTAGEVAGFFKAARAKAVSTTSSYIVEPDGATGLKASRAESCASGTPVSDTKLALEFPTHVLLTSTVWSVCFNSRGFPDANIVVSLEDDYGENYSIEVFLGGAVQVQ